MTSEEITCKLTEHEQRIKVCEHRESDLEAQNDNIQRIAMNTHDLTVSMNSMAKIQENQGERIDIIEKQPVKTISKILWTALAAVISALIGGTVGAFFL